MESNLKLVSFVSLCNHEDDIVNNKICWYTGEFKLFSRTCVVTDSTVIISNTTNFSIAQLNKDIFKCTFINCKGYVISDQYPV